MSKKLYGLYPRNFPKGVRELVDQDYAKDLPPEAQEWLSKFNEEFYAGKFSKTDPLHTDQEAKRAIWRDKHHLRKDLAAKNLEANFEEAMAGLETQNGWTSEPIHTQTPEYKKLQERVKDLARKIADEKKPSAELQAEYGEAKKALIALNRAALRQK